MALQIDPNRPSQQEVAAHNMKVAKANLACDLAKQMVGRLPFNPETGNLMNAKEVADFCVSVSETIIETYTFMPDGAGNRGGLTS